MPNYSRRGFAGFLLALLYRASPLQSQSNSPAPVTPRNSSRTYRADAIILFLGLTIFRRAGVGGGKASVETEGEGASLRRTLFFAAGSDPKRAHGLSRLGWMREIIVGPPPKPTEVSYFGVLTSSPEESLDGARKSMAAPQSGRSIFSAVSGRNTPGHSRSALTHFEFSTGALWSDRSLLDHAQSVFQSNVQWRETAWPQSPEQPPPTFLHLFETLVKQRARRAAGKYVYNEQEFLMELLTPQGPDREQLLPVRGKIRNLQTGRETAFRLWLENTPDSVVPVRIEFQPRSFLRLTFEAVSG